MLPRRLYTFIDPEGVLFEGENTNEIMQLPVPPFNYKHSLRHNFGLPKNYKYFIELGKEETLIEQPMACKRQRLDQEGQYKTKPTILHNRPGVTDGVIGFKLVGGTRVGR